MNVRTVGRIFVGSTCFVLNTSQEVTIQSFFALSLIVSSVGKNIFWLLVIKSLKSMVHPYCYYVFEYAALLIIGMNCLVHWGENIWNWNPLPPDDFLLSLMHKSLCVAARWYSTTYSNRHAELDIAHILKCWKVILRYHSEWWQKGTVTESQQHINIKKKNL